MKLKIQTPKSQAKFRKNIKKKKFRIRKKCEESKRKFWENTGKFARLDKIMRNYEKLQLEKFTEQNKTMNIVEILIKRVKEITIEEQRLDEREELWITDIEAELELEKTEILQIIEKRLFFMEKKSRN